MPVNIIAQCNFGAPHRGQSPCAYSAYHFTCPEALTPYPTPCVEPCLPWTRKPHIFPDK